MSNLLHDGPISILSRGHDLSERIWRRVRAGSRSAPMRLFGDESMLVRGAENVDII